MGSESLPSRPGAASRSRRSHPRGTWWRCWTSAAAWPRPTSYSRPRVCRVSSMLRWSDLSQIPQGYGPSVVTMGNFDGVHQGHQTVLATVVQRARDYRSDSTADGHAVTVTFD